MAIPNIRGTKIELHGAASIRAMQEQDAWVAIQAAQREKDAQYTLLTSSTAPDDWATDWTDYYQKVNNDYVQLAGESAPVYAANKYYEKKNS